MASTKRVAIVTGAATGIGRAIAQRLAKDGLNVALNDLESQSQALQDFCTELCSGGETKAIIVAADVSKEDEVREMVDKTVSELGSLDVMIANAGTLAVGSIVDLPVDEWDRLFSVNARGVFLCYKYAAKQMLAQGRGGQIVGASSLGGKKGEPGLGAYSSTKFAVRGLTQTAAQELGAKGIRVNAYAPGLISTNMLGAVVDGLSKLRGIPSETLHQGLSNASALKREGSPDEVASLVSFLISDNASFINGQTISVDWGIYFD